MSSISSVKIKHALVIMMGIALESFINAVTMKPKKRLNCTGTRWN